MIRTGPDGRRRSERTAAEDAGAVDDALTTLPTEAQVLFRALLDEADGQQAAQLGQDLEEGLYHTVPVPMGQFLDDPYYLGESMTTLYPELREVLIQMFSAPYREVLLAGSIGYGKCVDGDTELYDPIAGRRVTVREASMGSFGAVTWDGSAATPCSARAIQSGWKPLGWLTMRSGVRVRMSSDHPVLTPYGFSPVGTLAPGSLVASLRRTPPPVYPLSVGDDEVVWVAYMLADGGSTQASMTFTNGDKRLHAEFEQVTRALAAEGTRAAGCRLVRQDGKAWTVCPRGVQWLRRKYALTASSRTKRVPASFYGLSDRQLGLFLNRVWACDGWVSRHPPGGWTVGIALASEAFIRDIQQLLLRFGIRAPIRQRTMHYRYKGERRSRPAWSLDLHACASVRTFLDAVGDVFGKEDGCRAAREELRGVASNPNVDITPMDGEARRRLRREIGPVPRETWWPRRPFAQKLGRDSMVRLRAEHPLPDWCRWWPDVFWDEVVSYNHGVVTEPAYDVEVPSYANFTPQGMIVHNTYLATVALCRIIYELSCMRNPQRTLGIGPGTELAIMLVSKSLPLCRDVLKTAVDDKIKLSPYFMGKFAPKFSTDFTMFPNNIRLTVGSYGAERALGKAVLAAVLDECLGKKSVLTLRKDDTFLKLSVGELWEMDPAERDGLRAEALDHGTGQRVWVPFRMRESSIQPLVRIETPAHTCAPSLDHPVLVRRGDWLVYVPAEQVEVGDETVWRVDHGEEGRALVGGDESENVGIHADGRALGGCRTECLPVAALPSEFSLARVTATHRLPPEQTYSIETACQTFVADGCVVHNTNFPPKRNAQQIQQTMGKQLTAAHFDIVERVYRSLVRRIKSRFARVGGDLPGMVILASSAATLDSFTERKIREAGHDPDVYVVEHSQWSARPQEFFCGEVFHVLCSRSSLRSRILTKEEYAAMDEEYLEEHEAWVIEVPVEYRDDFEGNLEDSLRDIAGVSTQAISAFFQRVEAIDTCVDPDRPHPFTSEVWVAGTPGAFNWPLLCRSVARRLPGGFTEESWLPREDPHAPRWIHIDVSVSGDATGITMARIARWVEVVRRDGDGNRYTDMAPHYIVEVLLSVRPPPGEQIYLPDLRRIVYELQAHGFPIAGVSTDSYNAVEMHQQLRRHGMHAELISVDRTMDAYEELKSAIYERRIEYYSHSILINELRSLEYDRTKGKVDHPNHKTKDLSDSLAGAVWGLRQRAARLPWAADAATPRGMTPHEHQWVSPLIPADAVDLDEVRAMRRQQDGDVHLPAILFGDED